MVDKFEKDKIFYEDENFITILDGVILNKKSLIDKYKNDDWAVLVTSLYQLNGELFFNELRGSFSGAVYDKGAEKWIIFGDQLGTKFTYYTKVGKFFACSEVMGNMYHILKENNIDFHLDDKAALMLLTYGFMLNNYTLCKEVKKIQPGCYIVVEKEKITEKQYYVLDNTPNNALSEKEAIEGIDKCFRQAVKRQFDKDLEYGYKHLCAISAGLDCRMTSFVAHSLGYTKQLNFTYSESGYYDDLISKEMAVGMGHDWIFKTLDNGNWLYDADEVTHTIGGNVLYYGTAHANSLLKLLNFNDFGMIHSGQIGDVVIGTKTKSINEKFFLGDGAYSTKYLSFLNIDVSSIPNKEIGLFYYRYLNGTINGQQNWYNYTETFSPFFDLDFLEFTLKIPSSLRFNHYLYKKWIITKYPQAAKYKWEHIGAKITEPIITIKNRVIPLSQLFSRVTTFALARLRIKKRDNLRNNMNPIGYYLSHNKELKNFIDQYFVYSNKIENQTLKNLLIDISRTGNASEKLQAVSLLSVLKVYFP